MTRLKKVRQVLLYTLVLNIMVAAGKIFYGYSINSISMFSDGFHSFFDGASNVIGLLGIWIASQPPDKDHPYGHRKYETLSTIAIAVLIFAAGIEILRETFARIQTTHTIEVTYASFVVMGITLMVNIWVMRYEARKGRELKSDFLIADAMHTKADIYISLSVVISLIAASLGYTIVDIIASFIITIFIAKMGYEILKSATAVLTDAACLNPDNIKAVALSIEGVKECHGIRTRGNKNFMNIDLHIQVDPDKKIGDAHELAHTVEKEIKAQYPTAEDVVIHIEPFNANKQKL
jgi:cation diffusion facilitator family transporter